MTGGLLQLAAWGPQNVYLSGNPQITFFIAVYKRHTNFAIESIQQLPHGRAGFGEKFYIDIDPNADLVHEMFLQVKLPDLNLKPLSNPEYTVSWVNSIGNALIQHIDIEIGGSIIDRHYGQWLEIWNELTLKSEKEYAYGAMLGKHENFTTDTQPGPLNLYIPLIFWFNRNVGLSLPLISLQYSKVRIVVNFRQFDELWVSSNGKPPGLGGEESSVADSLQIDEVILWVDYIFLDNDERKKFASCNLEYLIEQLQVNTQSVDEKDYLLELDFNHPVKELIWVCQTNKIFQTGPNKSFEYFDFSNGEYPCPGDTITRAKLRLNGADRFREREAKFFRVIQPYQRHTRVPRNFIYVYSFALQPEAHQPTGTCNFSRIDNATLEFTLDDCVIQKETQIIVYATNYNVLKIEGGIAGLIYAD
jgi:hypothetical protein